MITINRINQFPIIAFLALGTILFHACKDREMRPGALLLDEQDLRSTFPSLAVASEGLDSRVAEICNGTDHVLPAFRLLYSDALQYPGFAERLCRSLLRDSRMPEALIHHTFAVLGAPAGGWGPPPAGIPEGAAVLPVMSQVERSMEDLDRELGFHFSGDDINEWRKLPVSIRATILEAFTGMVEAGHVLAQFTAPLQHLIRKAGFSGEDFPWDEILKPWNQKQLAEFEMLDLVGKADLRKLSFASRMIATHLNKFSLIDTGEVGEDFRSCIIETSMGRLGIFGKGRDTIRGSFYLSVDLGGDDLYMGPDDRNKGLKQTCALLADLGGDDTYDCSNGLLAHASMGIGMLMDFSGHDTYMSGRKGMVSACYGTALLYDFEGDDHYISEGRYSQGAAHVGVAILVDLAGDDRYCAGDYSQGYGGTLGLGLLLDAAGCDLYNVPKECVSSDHEASFIQGAARGRWAEATDGHSQGGGIGILIDGGGSDEYHAGSFSQGAGYFMGGGIFFDLQGDDTYRATSHSQGYAAHYALGICIDQSGHDRYNTDTDPLKITQIMGGGRDLSFGCFVDGAGDDHYHFGNRSAGIGDLNGIGLFWDRDGNDSYTWHKNHLNQGSASMGQTLDLAPGMESGMRLFYAPGGDKLGVFRDDHGMRLSTETYHIK